MSSRRGVITEDAAKYWIWMKSKPAGDVENVFYGTNTASSNKLVVGDQANNWEERAFAVDSAGPLGGFIWPPRSYSCSFCEREFRSAQALGGHMNVHRRDRARLKESNPSIDQYSPNTNNIHRAVVYSSDHSIASQLPLSSAHEIRDVKDAAEKTILLVSPSFAWPPTVVHDNNYAHMKEAAGSILLSLDLPQTADPVLVRVLSRSGNSSSNSTVVCQSSKLDEEKSLSEVRKIELTKEDIKGDAGSAVTLSSNIDSNRLTLSSNNHHHASTIVNKRRRKEIQPSFPLSLLMPTAAGSASSVLDKEKGLLYSSYNSSMDELDLELRL